jgi:acyl-CoA synthetase (AMP-forming)/AMP-acid ligase II
MADLIRLVRAAESAYPTRIATRSGPMALTFAQVADRSNQVATLLRQLHGAGEGLVALLIGNRIEAVECDIALVKAGLGRVSLNPRLSYDEMRFIIGDSGARVLVYAPEYADVADELAANAEDLLLVRLAGGGPGPGTDYEEALAAAAPTTGVPAVAAAAPSLLMYTSGTTGRPKGAIWTFATRLAGVANMLTNELDAAAARVMIHVGSLSHGSGSKVVPVYLRGGCNFVLPRFEPEEFFRESQKFRGTATFVVPTMVQMLVEAAQGVSGNPLQSMRHVAYGGAKMPLPTILAGLERFGDIFFQVYGSCEAPHPMLFLDRFEHATRDPRVLGSAGRAAIGVEVRIGSGEGLALPGAQGEILVRAPSVMSGYWQDDAATAEVIRDGFYHTGDVGLVHPDGLIEVVDRIKNMIISGGFNVYPAEVERVLAAHPKVSQVCVYGLPDGRWGEIVAAAVVPVDGAQVSTDELASYCGEKMAGYKKPRAFMFARQFPTGPTGKVLAAELRRKHELQEVS